MTEDFYDLLDVPSDASQDEIKDAYREQVRVYHPDHNDDDRARAQFTAVKKANDILGDPVERQAYDRLGHEDYVAKRTSGLPSADVWRSTETNSSGSDSDSATGSERTTSGDGSRTTFTDPDETANASSDAASGASKTTAKSAAGTTAGGTTSTGGSSTSTRASATGTTAGTATGNENRGAGESNRAAGSTDGGMARGTARSRTGGRSGSGRFGDNAVVGWWRRQNFSLPLIWLSVVVYLAGLVDFGLANESALRTLSAELSAVGGDPAGIWETLSSSRYGVDPTAEYLVAFELVAPALERPLWNAALAGIVGLTVVALFGARVLRDRETTAPVSIDETIVLALALTVATTLAGGPLLAGAVLMPVLFGLIVRHTRRGPGWKPSYLYVVPVLAPAVGFGIAAAGEATLALDLVTFVALPLVGALGLPLRATIRKRFGR
ncbi:J domain-containing protein [Natronorubrum halophilum]|uniref:J domain-containing protein n=1 Tax=Natronorubrum halophilum TaxID=1702106 RepID=UPI0010C185A1|nr:DnaJ domain-containing protein [Natronorubrum halophilum]